MSDTTDGTDLGPRTPMTVATMDEAEYLRTWDIAKGLAASGIFKDAKQASQAFTKILLGRDLGLTPTQSMTGLHVIEGKIEVAAVTLASFIRRKAGYDYSVEWRVGEGDDRRWVADHEDAEVSGCAITFSVEGAVVGISRWTVEDTVRAGLDKDRGSAKSNHLKYPRSMYFSRAMSNGVKWYVSEVTGGVPVYHEGEIQRVENLAAGEGTGELPGVDLPPEVERVIERAAAAGHAGLSDRATIEMMLGGQPPTKVAEWVARATETLDAMAVVAAGEDREPDDDPRPASEPVVACAATDPSPSRRGYRCERPEGHDGLHRAEDEEWESFLPDPAEVVDVEIVDDEEPSADEIRARSLEEKALALMDQAEGYRAEGKGDKADVREAEAEKLIAEARAISDPAQKTLGGVE